MEEITDVCQARAIISKVGEPYQEHVYGDLMSLTYYHANFEDERKAQIVIENMEKEYVLNIANQLLADKKELIPDCLLRDWSEDNIE